MIDYGKPVRDTMVVNVSRDAKHPREMTDDRHVHAGPQPRVTGQSTPPRLIFITPPGPLYMRMGSSLSELSDIAVCLQ